MLVPLGAEDTKWGICAHKVVDLCTQSGGFVGATLRSSALTPVCVRDRPLLNDWQMDALYYAQYAPIPNFATLPNLWYNLRRELYKLNAKAESSAERFVIW